MRRHQVLQILNCKVRLVLDIYSHQTVSLFSVPHLQWHWASICVIIVEDPWHSHLLPRVWRKSCNVLFLGLTSIATTWIEQNNDLPHTRQTVMCCTYDKGPSRTPISCMRGEQSTIWAPATVSWITKLTKRQAQCVNNFNLMSYCILRCDWKTLTVLNVKLLLD